MDASKSYIDGGSESLVQATNSVKELLLPDSLAEIGPNHKILIGSVQGR